MLSCVLPQIHMLKAQPPVPRNATLFGDRIFTEMIKVRSIGGPSSSTTGGLITMGNLEQVAINGEQHVIMRTATYKPGREAWDSSFSHSPQKEPTLPTP